MQLACKIGLILLLMKAGIANPILAAPTITTASSFDPAGPAPIAVTGVKPGETLTLIAARQLEVWRPDAKGNWGPRIIRFTAWATYKADTKGAIDLNSTVPISGSFPMADPLGLLWSGHEDDSAALKAAVPADILKSLASKEGSLSLRLLRGPEIVAEAHYSLASNRDAFITQSVQQEGMVGVFAAPKNAKRLPTLIILHGSEGSNLAKARSSALQWAGQGFATFSLAWYTPAYEAEKFVPNSGLHINVNQLEMVRGWLAQRPEADVRRMGIYGTSKGGEFAMLAASRFDWVKAATGCVPSDIVWMGFGEGENTLPLKSTWVMDGKPLPFVPLYRYAPEKYRDNTERYERSRRYHPAEALAARIPIERTRAKLLVIGGDRDEVWASGAMARNLQAAMISAGKGKQIESLIFDKAGHSICGDGSFPVRAYGKDGGEGDQKDLTAEGHATMQAFRKAIGFFKKSL